jgi:hypothetical protein
VEELFQSEIMKYRWWVDDEENLNVNEVIPMRLLKYYKNQKERKVEEI